MQKYYRFDKVFASDPNVDVGSYDRETLSRQGVSEAMHEMQSRAYGFLSRPLKIKTDIGRSVEVTPRGMLGEYAEMVWC